MDHHLVRKALMPVKVRSDRRRHTAALSVSRPFAVLADLRLAEGNLASAAKCIEDAYAAYDAAVVVTDQDAEDRRGAFSRIIARLIVPA